MTDTAERTALDEVRAFNIDLEAKLAGTPQAHRPMTMTTIAPAV